MQCDTSRDINQVCQYVEAKGCVDSLRRILFKALSNLTSFYFSLSSGVGDEVWTGAAVPNIVGYCVLSWVWSYYLKYRLSNRVPIGCEVAGCARRWTSLLQSCWVKLPLKCHLHVKGRWHCRICPCVWAYLSPIVHHWQYPSAPTWFPRI